MATYELDLEQTPGMFDEPVRPRRQDPEPVQAESGNFQTCYACGGVLVYQGQRLETKQLKRKRYVMTLHAYCHWLLSRIGTVG